jgi:hypothetical protein
MFLSGEEGEGVDSIISISHTNINKKYFRTVSLLFQTVN